MTNPTTEVVAVVFSCFCVESYAKILRETTTSQKRLVVGAYWDLTSIDTGDGVSNVVITRAGSRHRAANIVTTELVCGNQARR